MRAGGVSHFDLFWNLHVVAHGTARIRSEAMQIYIQVVRATALRHAFTQKFEDRCAVGVLSFTISVAYP